MPTYITLGRWTQQGVEKIKESPARPKWFSRGPHKGGSGRKPSVRLQKTNTGRSSQLCREQVRASDAPPCCT